MGQLRSASVNFFADWVSLRYCSSSGSRKWTSDAAMTGLPSSRPSSKDGAVIVLQHLDVTDGAVIDEEAVIADGLNFKIVIKAPLLKLLLARAPS